MLIGFGGIFKKGLFYTVKEVTQERATLLNLGGEAIDAPLAAVYKQTRLAHALTYACCQGLSLQGRVKLMDASSPHFTRRHLYVGISRATAASLVEVL